MATNLTIESPNFEKISKEAGQFTADAISLLWSALNDTRAVERRDFRQATEILQPKVLTSAPSADVDNLDLQGSSILLFNTASSVNFSGMRAPETGHSRVVFVYNVGAGTITHEHEKNSQTANQLSCASGADTAHATRAGAVYVYVASKWKEVA